MRGSVAGIGLAILTLACQIPDGGRADAATATAVAVLEAESGQDARVRRVWAHARSFASPSPDGRYVAYVDWSTGDVAMHDLRTGEDERLTDKGPWTENGSWAEYPLFSPDGERVAYAYGNAEVSGADHRYELRVVDVGNPEQRVLRAVATEEFIGPLDWSRTRGILVETNREDDTAELALIDPRDGSLQTIETFPEGTPHPHAGAVSPDGRTVVYRRGERVYLRDLETERERALNLRVRSLLGWAPEGNAVLVHTSREGTSGIWALPVSEGRVTGQPRLVRDGVPQLLPGGFAADRYYYQITVDAPKIHRATVDPAAGRLLSSPRALTSPMDGAAEQPVWSPDGGSLAYSLTNPGRRGSEVRLMIRTTHGDGERELARTDLQVENLRWSADGEALAFLAESEAPSVPDMYRLDLRTGRISRAVEGAGNAMALAPDGRTAIFLRHPIPHGSDASEIVVRDLEDGSERPVLTVPRDRDVESLALSPDAERIAFVSEQADTTSLNILRLGSDDVKEIYSVGLPQHLEKRPGDLTWTPDGRHLLVVRGVWEEEDSHELLAVPAQGGEPVPVADWNDRRWAALHPDGRRLAFTGGQVRTELWVLEKVTKAVETALSETD